MKLLNLTEVAVRLGVSVGTARKMATAGELPGGVLIHKRLKYREDSINAFIESAKPAAQRV